jgi:hypothetical protein
LPEVVMTRTPIRIALFVFAFLLMPLAGFGQPGTGTSHEISGTWSGIFALANPNGTVSHNEVVLKIEVQTGKWQLLRVVSFDHH